MTGVGGWGGGKEGEGGTQGGRRGVEGVESDSDAGNSDSGSATSLRDAPLGEYDYVCVCVPAARVAPLLEGLLPPTNVILEAARRSRSAPVWSVVMEFEWPLPVNFQAAFCQVVCVRVCARVCLNPKSQTPNPFLKLCVRARVRAQNVCPKA